MQHLRISFVYKETVLGGPPSQMVNALTLRVTLVPGSRPVSSREGSLELNVVVVPQNVWLTSYVTITPLSSEGGNHNTVIVLRLTSGLWKRTKPGLSVGHASETFAIVKCYVYKEEQI